MSRYTAPTNEDLRDAYIHYSAALDEMTRRRERLRLLVVRGRAANMTYRALGAAMGDRAAYLMAFRFDPGPPYDEDLLTDEIPDIVLAHYDPTLPTDQPIEETA